MNHPNDPFFPAVAELQPSDFATAYRSRLDIASRLAAELDDVALRAQRSGVITPFEERQLADLSRTMAVRMGLTYRGSSR